LEHYTALDVSKLILTKSKPNYTMLDKQDKMNINIVTHTHTHTQSHTHTHTQAHTHTHTATHTHTHTVHEKLIQHWI